MSDTSGRTSGMPSQPYARRSRSSRTWTDTGLLGLEMLLGTLPTWGCLRGGELFELPTPELPTAGSGSSSLSILPTPTAQAAKHGETPDLTANGFGSKLWDLPTLLPTPVADHSRGLPQPGTDYQSLPNAVIDLLPTPTAQDGKNTAGPSQHRRNTLPLNTEVTLLPTPTVMDMGANYTPEEWEAWKQEQKANHHNGNGHGPSLFQECLGVSMSPLSDAGNGSSTDPHQHPLSQVVADDHDSALFSWSG